MLKNNIKYFYFLLLLVVIGCAKRGNIDGGAKDTIPPVLKMSFPKNFSNNFAAKKIELSFDEYVKLKNLEKELIISPPMKKSPEITPTSASKTIFIEIKDTLRENTTYSLNFGKSIEDNNEGNPFQEFKYIFSTGSYIDSLMLNGTIKDGYDRKMATNLSLLLYEADSTFTDSIIYKENPRYITKTIDSAKVFKFENLKEGKYYLIALKDENRNNKFDARSEKIAFRKQPITIPNDSIFELKLFKEVPKFKAYAPKQVSGNRLTMGYQGSPKNMKINLKSENEVLPTIITKIEKKDSVEIWFKPLKVDSLNVEISNEYFNKNFITKFKSQKNDTLIISAISKSNLPFRDAFTLKSTVPLVKFDDTKLQLIDKDSTTIAYTKTYDDWTQELKFEFEKEPTQKYQMKILPGAFVDYLERENDTLNFKFETQTTNLYGNLFLTLENVKSFPIIIEITNPKGDIIASEYSEGETKINFKLIDPNSIIVRIIYDVNKNKEWDTGNFIEKIQPEEVFINQKSIPVRANWDVIETINLSP